MAKAWISEYVNVKLVQTPNGGYAQCAEGPPIATQVVDFTAGATATSNAFNDKTRFLRVKVNSDCHRKWGSAPTATTSDEMMSSGDTEYVGVPPDHGSADGQTAYKLGFIINS